MTERRARRRAQILDISRQIVVEEGLDALSFGAIEKRVDFTRGVITYHFKNKDDILHALLDLALEDVWAEAESRIVAAEQAGEGVRSIVSVMVRAFLSRPDAVRVLMGFWGRLQADERAADRNARLYEGYRRATRGVIGRAQERGHLLDADAEALSVVIVGLVIGIAGQAIFEEGAVDVEAAVAEVGRLLGPSAHAMSGA